MSELIPDQEPGNIPAVLFSNSKKKCAERLTAAAILPSEKRSTRFTFHRAVSIATCLKEALTGLRSLPPCQNACPLTPLTINSLFALKAFPKCAAKRAFLVCFFFFFRAFGKREV